MPIIVKLFALAVAGALAGVYLPHSETYAVCALCAAICWAGVRLRSLRHGRSASHVSERVAQLAFLGLGFLGPAAVAAHECEAYSALRAQLPFDRPVVLEGTLLEIVPTRSGGSRWRVAVTGWLQGPPNEAQGVSRAFVADISVSGRALRLAASADDRVRIRTRLHPLAPQDTPGTFDPFHFGLARSIHARGSLRQPADVLFLERPLTLLSFAQVRAELRERLLRLVSPKEAAILLALLVGETALFEPSELEAYRRVGAGHLLAVSGLQVSALAWVIYRFIWLLFWLIPGSTRRGEARIAASLASLAAIWCFVALCGAPPSVCRAAGMASVILLAPMIGHRVRGMEAIAWTGWCSLLWQPLLIIDPSFLLSYGAILGLLNAIDFPSSGKGRKWKRLAIAGVAPGVCTAPISVALFGAWSPGGLLANCFLVPAAAILQVPAIGLGLVGASMQSPAVTHWGALTGGLLEALCLGMDDWLGGLWWLEAPDSPVALALYVAALLVIRGLGSPRGKLYLISGFALGATCICTTAYRPSGVAVTALPVGQGDSLVVRLPSGHVILVDGGGVYDGAYDPGEEILLPYFRRHGIQRIDLILISHPHPDHVLGLHAVLQNLSVGAVIHPGYGDEHPLMRSILQICRKHGVPVHIVREKMGKYRLGKSELELLAPYPEDGSVLFAELGANDNSLVARLRYGKDSFLLTGDIEAYGELYLLASGVSLRASVVKAPHHGSRTSSSEDFIAATAAEHVLFTTGWRNSFGFPHPEIERRWRAHGAQIWDTSRHGELTFWLTGDGVKIKAHRYPGQPQSRLTP